MGALDNLIASDTLYFDVIDLDLNGPEQAFPGPRHNKHRCIRKNVGELRFKLNSFKDLELSTLVINFESGEVQDPIDVDIEFVAEAPTTTVGGETSITWRVDQVVNRNFKFQDGITIHIDRIDGSVTTVVRSRLPRGVGTTCDGKPRSIGVDLQTIAGENKLTVRGSVSKGPLSDDAKITADNISMVAHGLEEFTVKPNVHIPRNTCGIGPSQGATFTAWGFVPAPPGSGPTYQWSISGAGSLVGRVDLPTVKVALDGSPNSATLTLTSVVEGVVGIGSAKCTPETKQTAQMKEIACSVRRLLRFNQFVNPLWDPLRDYVAKPLTLAELRRIERFGTDLAKQARSLLGRSR